MKVESLCCPNCKAPINNLSEDRNIMFCPFCGSQLHIDDEIQRTEKTININKTYTTRHIDEAKLKQAEVEMLKTHSDERKLSLKIKFLIGYVLFCFIVLLFAIISGNTAKTDIGHWISAGSWITFFFAISLPIILYLTQAILKHDETEVHIYEARDGFLGLHHRKSEDITPPGKKVLWMWGVYLWIMTIIVALILLFSAPNESGENKEPESFGTDVTEEISQKTE